MASPESDAAEHPSTARRDVSLAALLFGLLGAPCSWISAQLLGFGIAQRACFPQTRPLDAAAFGGVHVIQAAAIVAALGVSLAALAVAVDAWRRTRNEHAGGGQTLLAVGEGRSRFMAYAGILTSAGFLVATLFSAPVLFVLPVC